MNPPNEETSQKRDKSKKFRSSRACDNCRKSKTKCEQADEDGSCHYCVTMQLECHFTMPASKRGPAKGYLQALETRCHNVEAVLGILLALPDERATSLLTELSDDPYARRILDQVNTSAFGPSGRASIPETLKPNLQSSSAESSTSTGRKLELYSF